MKFYKDKHKNDYYYHDNIKDNYISCIYYDGSHFIFFKNGIRHNSKNVAYIGLGYKTFYLNDNLYGNQHDFTKESWRRFVKLQVFL